MTRAQRQYLFERHKQMTDTDALAGRRRSELPATGPLVLPLIAKDNRPIYDATGRLVSIPEHAQWFAEAANLLGEIRRVGGISGAMWERMTRWAEGVS